MFQHSLEENGDRNIPAGRVTSETGAKLILGLSRLHIRRSPAAHELFHLSRDIRGIQSLSMDKIPGQLGRIREELVVWNTQFRYAPLLTSLEGLGTASIYIGVPVGIAFWISPYLYGEGR